MVTARRLGLTCDSWIPRASTSRMSRIVACCACWLRFTGGRRSIPAEIAFGLGQGIGMLDFARGTHART